MVAGLAMFCGTEGREEKARKHCPAFGSGFVIRAVNERAEAHPDLVAWD